MSENLVWQLEIVRYFVKKYRYKIIKIVDDVQTNKDNPDYFLVNNTHKKYPLIRVSIGHYPISEEEKIKIGFLNKQIGKLINNSQDVLSVYTKEYNGESLEENTIFISDTDYNGKDLNEFFPELKNTLKKVTDINQEIANITLDLNNFLTKKNKWFDNIDRIPYVTYIVTFLCILFYILANVFTKNFNNFSEANIFFGAYYKIFIMAGEYWRFLTVALTHANLLHLSMNIIALVNLGNILERLYGHLNFLIILIASIIGGSVMMYVLDRNVLAVGISGGVFGLLGSLIVYYIHSGMIKNPTIRSNIISVILINAAISFLPGIALFGHLGGFMFGILFGMLFTNNSSLRSLHKHTLFSIIILSTILVYFVIKVPTSTLSDIYIDSDIKVIENIKSIGLDKYAKHLTTKLIEIYESY